MHHFAILEGEYGKVAVVEVLLRPELESQVYYECYYKRFIGGDRRVLILESNQVSKRKVFADCEEAIQAARQLMMGRAQELQNAIHASGLHAPQPAAQEVPGVSSWDRLLDDGA